MLQNQIKWMNTTGSTLMSRIDRGGLWDITKDMEGILLITESFFRAHTKGISTSHKIDIETILQISIIHSAVQFNTQKLCDDAELRIEEHVANDMIRSIIKLYMQVRFFSHAKDILQRYKIKEQKSKVKRLRKEIQRATKNENDMQNT